MRELQTGPDQHYNVQEYGIRLGLCAGRITIDNLLDCLKNPIEGLVRFEIAPSIALGPDSDCSRSLKFWLVEPQGLINLRIVKADSEEMKAKKEAFSQMIQEWRSNKSAAWQFIQKSAVSSVGFLDSLAQQNDQYGWKNAKRGHILRGKYPDYEKIPCLILDETGFGCLSRLKKIGINAELMSVTSLGAGLYIDPKAIRLTAKQPASKIQDKFAKEILRAYSEFALSDPRYVYLSKERLTAHRLVRRRQSVAPGESTADYAKRLGYSGLDPLAAHQWKEPGWFYLPDNSSAGQLVFKTSPEPSELGFSHTFEKEGFTRCLVLVAKGVLSVKKAERPKKSSLVQAPVVDNLSEDEDLAEQTINPQSRLPI